MFICFSIFFNWIPVSHQPHLLLFIDVLSCWCQPKEFLFPVLFMFMSNAPVSMCRHACVHAHTHTRIPLRILGSALSVRITLKSVWGGEVGICSDTELIIACNTHSICLQVLYSLFPILSKWIEFAQNLWLSILLESSVWLPVFHLKRGSN